MEQPYQIKPAINGNPCQAKSTSMNTNAKSHQTSMEIHAKSIKSMPNQKRSKANHKKYDVKSFEAKEHRRQINENQQELMPNQ